MAVAPGQNRKDCTSQLVVVTDLCISFKATITSSLSSILSLEFLTYSIVVIRCSCLIPLS